MISELFVRYSQYALFVLPLLAHLVTLNSSPLLRYLDPFVILDRHYFAPRAKSDEELYFCFRGGWYNLSERFTDFTKVLLLCTFYSAFMPMIWWLGAAILFFQCKGFTLFVFLPQQFQLTIIHLFWFMP